jgi:hypothetical protein
MTSADGVALEQGLHDHQAQSSRSNPVEIAIGGRKLGPMVLTEARCGGENYRHDIAVLVFRPANVEASA